MNFFRAGHEGDWDLHLFAAEAMLPYFLALLAATTMRDMVPSTFIT